MDDAVAVAAIVMAGIFLSVVAWKVLDIGKHAVISGRSRPHRTDEDDAGDQR